jgi:hypothetical protein
MHFRCIYRVMCTIGALAIAAGQPAFAQTLPQAEVALPESVTPAKPDEPAKPAKPDEPAKPAKPVEPASLAVDGGLLFGLPAALGTGQTTGLGLGIASSGPLAWGARASWSQATEYTTLWAVTHADIRLRATVTAQRQVGRGLWLIRLGAGGTVVHETRVRDQSARLSSTGQALTTSAWALLPGFDLEFGTWLRIAGDWGVTVTGGPSLHVVAGAVQPGWLAQLGVAWLP